MRTPFVLVGTSLADVPADAAVPLDATTVHHLRRVLRRDDAADLELCDGAGWTAPARLAGDHATTTAPAGRHPAPRPPVTVVHALCKGRVLDEVVRVLTELGVARLVPVVTARTVARPTGERAARAVARWQAVADAAVAQARRPHRLVVAPVAALDALPADLDAGGPGALRLVAHPGAPTGLATAVRGGGTAAVDRCTVAVGPEGGLADDEVAGLAAGGWAPVHLGAGVLRAEHAATVAVAALHALTGRLDGA